MSCDYRIFYNECQVLKKPWVPSEAFNDGNLNAMKIPYTPSLKTNSAAIFDYIVETRLQILENENRVYKLPENPSFLVSRAKKIITNDKINVIKFIKIEHPNWHENEFEEWIDAKINLITESNIPPLDLSTLFNRFWKKCAEEWTKECNMEKYTPDEELMSRMIRVVEHTNATKIECFTFAMCYINTDEIFEKNSSTIQFADYFRLVTDPKEGDLIIYLDSDNETVHAGVVLDSTHVISKFGKCSIMKHHFQDCHYGDSYVFLRKRDKFWA